jgi:sortase A
MRWLARLLGALGRLLVASGVLILLFVAYQLWGTNIREAQAQRRLEDEFSELLDDARDDTDPETTTTAEDETTTTTVNGEETTTTTAESVPLPEGGDAVARLQIARIGLDKIVVEGVGLDDLKRGPGHYPTTPMPGQEGNAAIAGHRTTYGAPFHRLDELRPGDEITVTTVQGTFRYEVMDEEGDGDGHQIVAPSQTAVLEDKEDDRLTLTACHPKYSARQRIVVAAELVDEPVPEPPRPEGEDPSESNDHPDAVIDAGLDGARATAWPAVWFGLACAAVWFLATVGARQWRRWASYLVATPVFLVLLFFFYENFARLLPANF